MDQKAAFRETLIAASDLGMPALPGSPLGLDHLLDMYTKICEGDFSEDKLGRWLGWAQCAVVAADIGLTMDDMREINKAYDGKENR